MDEFTSRTATDRSTSLSGASPRGRIYRQLSELFLHADDGQPDEFLKNLPQLRAGWEATTDKSSDRWAADYYRTLGTNVFPIASVYLDPKAAFGGTLAEAVLEFYETAGYPYDRTGNESPDHVGHELAFLGWLCSPEQTGQQSGQPQNSSQVELQRHFLDLHLLRWFVVFAQALRRAGHPFYSAMADLTLTTLVDHRRELMGGTPSRFRLPDPPPLLERETTDLRELASYLLTPAYSGFFLSRDGILRLAESQGLPCGFGDRRRMLANLLQAAVQYDRLAGLVSALENVLMAWDVAYAEFEGFDESLAFIGPTWRERLARTLKLTERIGTVAK